MGAAQVVIETVLTTNDCWAYAVPFRFANVRGPAMSNVNKRWKLNERGTELQLRGEGNPSADPFSTAFG